MGRPELTICICTRNRPGELVAAVASAWAADPPVAAVVVSDDSTDERTRVAVAAMGDHVRYLEGPRRGLGANRNSALRGVTTSHLAYLDDDAQLDPAFVGIWRGAVDALPLSEHERVIHTGGEHNRGDVVYARATTFLGHQSRSLRPGEAPSTICINATVFPLRLFDRVSFDDRLVYGYDEVDIAGRAVAAGYRVVSVPELLNHHFPSAENRDYYAPHVEATRLYVTWKRYARVERSPARATAYCMVAPLHLLAHGVRRGGVAGARRSGQAIRQAVGLARAPG